MRTIRPLARYSRRPRAVRLEETELRLEPEIELRDEEYASLKPRLLWRGDRYFYDAISENERAAKRHKVRGGDYEAIDKAGENVDRLRDDPHAFDSPESTF